MNTRQNLHTHTIYCDGKNTPEEMVLSAIEKGHGSLGFSSHAYVYFSDYAGITQQRIDDYVAEVRRLQEKYKDTFPIYLGLEADMYAPVEPGVFQYLIGSTHYLKMEDQFPAFDGSAQSMKAFVDTWFGGDGMAFVKEYFRQLRQLPQLGKYDILGHFDLVSKHIEGVTLFDYDSDEYVRLGAETAEELAPHIKLFEVNTGAIARGYRTTPYPSPRLTKVLKDLGYGVVITSDCHDAQKLDCGYELSRQFLSSLGFRERFIFDGKGFVPVAL